MSTQARHAGVMDEAALVRMVDVVVAAHPEQIEVIRAFQPLLLARNRALSEVKEGGGATLEGVVNPAELPVDPDVAHDVLLRVLDAVSEGFPAMWEGAARVRERLSPALSGRLVRAWLLGDTGLVTELGEKLEVSVELLGFSLGQVCRVLVSRAAAALPQAPEDVLRRQCPYCGSAPELSVIHRVGEADGVRSLVCGQCGRGWRFQRTACPACGEDSAGTLQSLYVEDRPQERGMWCSGCDRYVLEVDIRHQELVPEQCQVLALGLGHLDMLLQQEGKLPLAMQGREDFAMEAENA